MDPYDPYVYNPWESLVRTGARTRFCWSNSYEAPKCNSLSKAKLSFQCGDVLSESDQQKDG